MHITGLRLANYASFSDTGWLELKSGINLFVGANNSGKSALLRSIVSPMLNNPHRGSGLPPLSPPPSSVELRVCTSVEDTYRRLELSGLRPVFPMGSHYNGAHFQKILSELLANPSRDLILEGVRVAGQEIAPLQGASITALRDQSNQVAMQVGRTANGYSLEGNAGSIDNLLKFLDSPSSGSLFYFGAQRVNIGQIGISDEIALKPDASNLPTVLANVQATRAPVFEKIEHHLSEILPGIERITIVPSGGMFEVFVWPQRQGPLSDLSFSLNASGSGVAQLLAILTAIVLHKQAVLIIDELNTYLHPAALRKLLRLMQGQYPQHQYIVSAHSADVIFGSNPSALFTVRRDALISEVSSLTLQTAQDARRVAGLLGISMLDVFGNDRLLWVEGPTEEIAFPLILDAFDDPLRPEIGISAVGSTSSFSESKARRDEVITLYENAGRRLSPLLQGMAFGLDRERLDDDAVKKLETSKRKLRFLPRRCLENYVLIPSVIARSLDDLGESISERAIEEEMIRLGGERSFGAEKHWDGSLQNSNWLKHVDAPRLLTALYSNLSESRQEFRKTRDTISLLRHALTEEREFLRELYDFVRNLVKIAERDTAP